LPRRPRRRRAAAADAGDAGALLLAGLPHLHGLPGQLRGQRGARVRPPLARGARQLRAVVTIGSQRIESPVERIDVKRARNWSTRSRDDGRYAAGGGLRSVTFKIASQGRELRGFNAKVPMLCPGIVPGTFTTQFGTAILRKVKIAPDGRCAGAAMAGGDSAILILRRTQGP
jgi:hypothetical protein